MYNQLYVVLFQLNCLCGMYSVLNLYDLLLVKIMSGGLEVQSDWSELIRQFYII